jgi:hypothetical protein
MSETEFINKLFIKQITQLTKKTPIQKSWYQ